MFFYKLCICLISFLTNVSYASDTNRDALSELVNSHSRTLGSSSSAASSSTTTPSTATDEDLRSGKMFPDFEDSFTFSKTTISFSTSTPKYVPRPGNVILSINYVPSSRTTTSTHVAFRSTNEKSNEDEHKSLSSLPKRGGSSVFQTAGGSIAFKSGSTTAGGSTAFKSGRTPSKKITSSEKKD